MRTTMNVDLLAPLTSKKGTARYRGWRVTVRYTEDPETAFISFEEKLEPDALKPPKGEKKPTARAVQTSELTDVEND